MSQMILSEIYSLIRGASTIRDNIKIGFVLSSELLHLPRQSACVCMCLFSFEFLILVRFFFELLDFHFEFPGRPSWQSMSWLIF